MLDRQKILISKKDSLKKRVSKVSKYYLSEGFLIYSISKVARKIGININQLVNEKINLLENKVDLAFVILSLEEPDKILIKKYKEAKKSPLPLFQNPSKKEEFYCSFLDEVVIKCAELKLHN